MGTSSRRTERVLADAAIKIAKAEGAIESYTMQKNEALEKKKQLEDENEKLRATILSLALQHANVEYRREHVQLRQTLDSYQTKIDQMREISLLNAKVVDSRIKTKQGRQYVEYKLQIETDIRGTLVLWHRYSTFLNLAATLKAKNPSSEHEIPELQTQSLTGFFSDQLIIDRIAKLNEFLEVVTKADEFQWGIRMDKDTVVYKRKTKRGSGGSERSYSGGSRESISTLTMSSRDSMFMSPVRQSTIAMADSL
ncbi:Myosin-like protein, partial [Globisporangium splendens]